MEEQIKIITNYIAVWAWHILAIISLCTSMILISIPSRDVSLILFFATFISFVLCEVMAYKRKNDLSKQ